MAKPKPNDIHKSMQPNHIAFDAITYIYILTLKYSKYLTLAPIRLNALHVLHDFLECF